MQKITEARLQQDCVTWFRNSFKQLANLLYKNHNEGRKNLIAASLDKAMGLTSGIPDLFLAIPNNSFHGLYLELKVPGQKPTKVQTERITQLQEQGYQVEIITTLDQFQNVIQLYLQSAKV